MDKFRFFIFSAIAFIILGILGYWAVVSIESGSAHASKDRLNELEDRNRELEEQVEDLKNELALYKETEQLPEEETPPEQPVSANYKYQTLISELEKLMEDNIVMKSGSKGTRVGTIQNVLNLYNNTTKRVDNDYGKTTVTDVTNFQKKEGLPTTGQTGNQTYQKMIDWLKAQG